MSEKLELLHTDRVLIVEGKYDAARLSHLTDAMILLTDGFGIYKDKKRQQLFKQLAHKNGLILLTDSDAAGFRIRTYITNLVGEKNVVQAYVPAIHGKEKRKAQPGKEGLLGVEGVDDALVLQALRDALGEEAGIAPAKPEGRQITYTDYPRSWWIWILVGVQLDHIRFIWLLSRGVRYYFANICFPCIHFNPTSLFLLMMSDAKDFLPPTIYQKLPASPLPPGFWKLHPFY